MWNQSWHNVSASSWAKDLAIAPSMLRREFRRIAAGALVFVIGLYQTAISPLLGPHCRYHPTCSAYAKEAIRSYGPLGGLCRAIVRIARCHPLSAGGYDPVR
jgi:putative membrane protein insertion efficiency factor